MATIEIAIAAKILAQPLQDLYAEGKERFGTELLKWKNTLSYSQLARKIAKLQKVKTFWQRDKEVSLYSFFYPSPITFSEGVTKEIAGLSHFPRTGNFVIQGTVGQGKSIFLRHLCTQELGEKGSGRIPVFIELRLLKDGGLEAVIFDALDRLGFAINENLFDFYANSGKLVLLLDGFDEIEEPLISGTIKALERLSEKYENLQIIVTSRPSSAIQNSRHFRIVRLAPLKPADHPKFLKKIGLLPDEANKILKAIESSSAAVAGLLTTPLMMTLLVVVYRAEQAIPGELPEFYERLFQTLFSKHDSIKPGLPKRHKSGLSERKLQSLFEAFCFSVLQLKKKTTLSGTDFNKCYVQALQYVVSECDEDFFRHDITKAVCLMQEEGFDVHFVHKSVLEFFAASFVRGLNNEAAQRFYTQLHGTAWREWNQVIQFLSQIDRYRYATYYAIPMITAALVELNLDPNSTKIENLDKTIEEAYKKSAVIFSNTGDNVYAVSSVRTALVNNRFLASIEEPFIAQIFHPQNSLIELTRVAERAKRSRNSDNEISIQWREAFTSEGLARVEESFRKFIEGLYSALDDAKRFVEAENHLAKLIKI